ncbi:DUF3630 family protein [Catenovulum maritimum]|uniref:DUF3630 domain-containing protein n=1 Tax=Catenovulum maritimum TaxID=1513271 RepID=A0A0J8GSC2_9ALTE|nr:DUF3630 family protein [Catenovulum maritimum]KMT65700.1 hypothetical protein XM47_08390 [Catenovulum maritimum]
MQQLKLIALTQVEDVLQCHFNLELDWESAPELIESWLNSVNLDLKEIVLGADRISWRLLYDNQTINLCFEDLSGAIWFEADNYQILTKLNQVINKKI